MGRGPGGQGDGPSRLGIRRIAPLGYELASELLASGLWTGQSGGGGGTPGFSLFFVELGGPSR